MKIKLNYLLIPLVVVFVAFSGSFFTSSGMDWYDNEVIKPILNPPDIAFPIAWNIIFLCTAISAVIFYNKAQKKTERRFLFFKKQRKDIFYTGLWLFGLNAFLNIFWSFLFFYLQMPGLALIEIVVLLLNIAFLIFVCYKVDKISAFLLIPYILWVSFATYLNFSIWVLN